MRKTFMAVVHALPGDAPRNKIERVYDRLVETYGIPPWEPDHDPLGSLIGTILSQHTSDVNSDRAYAQLRASFPSWVDVRDAPVTAIAEAIRPGGLAQVKAERIQQVLRELSMRTADHMPLLDVLDDLSLDEATEYLESLPGVGPKTAACVLLFSLGRPAFPVDTHVHRVTQRLGFIGPQVHAVEAHRQLRDLIPPDWRHTMHVDLIAHGRRICHARRPECTRCPLRDDCDYFRDVVSTS